MTSAHGPLLLHAGSGIAPDLGCGAVEVEVAGEGCVTAADVSMLETGSSGALDIGNGTGEAKGLK